MSNLNFNIGLTTVEPLIFNKIQDCTLGEYEKVTASKTIILDPSAGIVGGTAVFVGGSIQLPKASIAGDPSKTAVLTLTNPTPAAGCTIGSLTATLNGAPVVNVAEIPLTTTQAELAIGFTMTITPTFAGNAGNLNVNEIFGLTYN